MFIEAVHQHTHFIVMIILMMMSRTAYLIVTPNWCHGHIIVRKFGHFTELYIFFYRRNRSAILNWQEFNYIQVLFSAVSASLCPGRMCRVSLVIRITHLGGIKYQLAVSYGKKFISLPCGCMAHESTGASAFQRIRTRHAENSSGLAPQIYVHMGNFHPTSLDIPPDSIPM